MGRFWTKTSLVSIRKLRMDTNVVFDLETSNFSQGQGNQAFERRRSSLRRTIKCAD